MTTPKSDRALLLAGVLPGALLALLLLLMAAATLATLEPAERAQLRALLEPRVAIAVMLWFFAAIALGAMARRLWLQHAAAPGRLAEQLQTLLASVDARELPEEAVGASAGSRALATSVNELVRQRSALRADIEARVREGSREVEQERSRLAALMSELTQSVVVCNLDGRVLLFNARARLQFRALADGPAVGGAELLSLGRSIYAVIDRRLVAHALESVQQRLQRGVPNPSAQFVTSTRGGQLLRVQMTPVRAPQAEQDNPIAGFVLMLDNITRDFADESDRDRMLHSFTETSRSSLGNLQAALELLDEPDLDSETRERFQAVVRDEAAAMTQRIQELSGHTTRTMKTRWPLEEMLGADLVTAAARRVASSTGCRADADEVDGSLWLKVDSFSLIQALCHLATRLNEEYGIRLVQLRLQGVPDSTAPAAVRNGGGRAHLDLVWFGQAMSTETVMSWETDALCVGGQTSGLSVRDVVERHGGAFWFERERVRQAAFFRFLLPLAVEAAEPLDAALVVHGDSRPEFYDFDLFQAGSEQARELADRPLRELSYTVFDTETTGLDPSAGDEIIQVGATRIVAAKLRRQDCFEQLVDPQRPIAPAGIAIHGIEQEMVQGQPTIDVVLPAFHAFAQDTVLVAHNAAFDMRFLQLKELRTGVRFEQPVLDTLLLSAVVHPQQESHRLEAIAERLGVEVLGRHTALGDAMVTAEVFLKMMALLEAQGIRTLGQALEASRRTRFARVTY
jgi:DNA polymerase III subunit epsilon